MSLRDDYYKKCMTCAHYALLNSARLTSKGFYCHDKGEYYAPNDSCNSSFFGGYSYNSKVSDREIKDALSMYEKTQGSGCFITTMIVHILKREDSNEYLDILRTFRNEVLQKDNKYSSLLYNYDKLGPIISASLEQDVNKEFIASAMNDIFINPTCKYILDNDYENAITAYQEMFNYLTNTYNIETIEVTNMYDGTYLENTGHGFIRELEKRD
jgi:hypothetical protein